MNVFMVGLIKEKRDIVGFKVVFIKTGMTMEYSTDTVIDLLKQTQPEGGIENLELVDGEIKGVNGSLDRYGVVGESQSCTILYEYNNENGDTIGYRVSDVNGNMKRLTVGNVIGVAEILGISNGKIIEKNGRKYISAISGSYKRITIMDN